MVCLKSVEFYRNLPNERAPPFLKGLYGTSAGNTDGDIKCFKRYKNEIKLRFIKRLTTLIIASLYVDTPLL